MSKPTYQSVSNAVAILSGTLSFGSGQGEANKLIARLTPIECDRCGPEGTLPGKRKALKCRRCGGVKRGYAWGPLPNIFWTGWAPGAQAVKREAPCICEGQRHWHRDRNGAILRTNWKTNPYCKAHDDETKTADRP